VAKTRKRKQAGKKRKLVEDLAAQEQQIVEIRRLLDDVLVAQHRTNHLLELALRAGFDDDERLRTS